jgi:hypothetical protein
MRSRTIVPALLLLPALLAGPAAAGPPRFRPPGRLVPAVIGALFNSGTASPGSPRAAAWRPDAELESPRGRQVLEFTPEELTDGLFLAVAGAVEFERVDYALDDGRVCSLDVFGLVREPGLYRLADLGGTHRVLWVRVVARAVSPRAALGLRLGLV